MRQITEKCSVCSHIDEYTKNDFVENTLNVVCKSCGEQFKVNNYTDYIETDTGENVVDKMLEASLFPPEVDGYQFNQKTCQYEMQFSWGISSVKPEINRKEFQLILTFSDNWSEQDKIRFRRHIEARIIKRYYKIMEDFENGLQKRNK